VTGRRAVPYPGRGPTLVVPAEVWHRGLEAVRTYGAQRSEALMFWGGVVSGDVLQVTGLYLPSHRPQGGCVRLTSEESRWLLRRLRDRDEKLLAQVHSHPMDAFHSGGDDRGAASFHLGYLSVVVPRFGNKVARIGDCEVLEFDGVGFTPLSPEELGRRIRVLYLVEDRVPRPARLGKEEGWLSSIGLSLRRRLTAPRRR
jgi:hypothetical protein